LKVGPGQSIYSTAMARVQGKRGAERIHTKNS
jgi:hypothetical protein